jgi:hypothetical protein
MTVLINQMKKKGITLHQANNQNIVNRKENDEMYVNSTFFLSRSVRLHPLFE